VARQRAHGGSRQLHRESQAGAGHERKREPLAHPEHRVRRQRDYRESHQRDRRHGRNKDSDNTDRPIKGINDLTIPIVSSVDSQGRAVINGITGQGSLGIDVSFRYQIPLKKMLKSLDLFYDVFNITNRVNNSNPSGNRASALFNQFVAAGFPRQMQFGVRVRF